MFIVRYRKFFYILSLLLIGGSIASFSFWGLKLGIEFKGGSLLEVDYVNRPTKTTVEESLTKLNFGAASVRETGDKGFIVRMKELAPAEKDMVVKNLSSLEASSTASLSVKRFDSIGPVLGKEALQKAYFSIALVLLAIVLFISFVFRRVSKPVTSWKYGIVAIIALAHDVIIPIGVFSVLGHVSGIEIDTLFVTALLVILGFSVHDTIVVFDRVRENLKRNVEYKEKKDFPTIVGESINQTFVRSINTSLSTLLAIVALYFFGPESTHHFSLALLIGITAGTYSSVFIGSPLLVTLYKWQERN